MTFLACLGKIFGDRGLLSILSDSQVYAEATARLLIQGKHYSRGVRAMKLVQEALVRLFFIGMIAWAEQNRVQFLTQEARTLLNDIQQAFGIRNKELATELIEEFESNHLRNVTEVFELFRDVGRKQSATFAYWDTFVNGTDILLQLLRAEKDGDFELHLITVSQTIPWLYAAGRNNYSKFVPLYISDMKKLAVEQPESYQHLKDGGFVVRRSDSYGFNCVSTDMALEQTINREGKGQGGVVGLTLRKGALTRWMLSRHVTAEYREAFQTLCNSTDASNRFHEELGKSRMTRDENDVQKIQETIQAKQNPFDLDTVPSDLINIVSGQVADAKVTEDLATCLAKGSQKHKDFLQKRLLENRNTSFWATVTRTKTATFSDMKKMLVSKEHQKLMLDSEVLFRRLLAVSKTRNVSLENVLTHELAAVPPALFQDDGSMRKTTKADLAKKLESNCEELNVLPPERPNSTAYIIDGMAFVQGLKESQFITFNDLANVVQI